MRIAGFHLLRSLAVLVACCSALPAAAGPLVIQLQRTDPTCASVVQYALTAVSYRPPLVSLSVVDNMGTPATLTLGSSSTERSRELASLATFMSLALRISQQIQAGQVFSLLSGTCDSIFDIHGSGQWYFAIQPLTQSPRFQVLLGVPQETFLVQYYSVVYEAGLSKTLAMSPVSGPRLEMGTTAPLYFNLQQAVRVAQHVASGHPYIFLTSYAQLDTDGWYRDPSGLQSTDLFSSYAGPP